MEQLTFDDLPLERWLPVAGYEGKYEVSDLGRVRSLDRIDGAGRHVRGVILKGMPAHGGYRRVTLLNGSRRLSRPRLVHHLVLEAFVGPRPDGLVCRHGPHGASDNSLSNLCYGTPAENQADKVRDGTVYCGEATWKAALTEESVREIVRLYAIGGTTHRKLAEQFGVSRSQVGAILSGQSWKHCHEDRGVAAAEAAFAASTARIKISDEQVLEIRSSPLSQADLARAYGVDPSTICHIKSGRSRKSAAA